MNEASIEIAYALDTFYFLMSGALVMWMAAGFTMLESGLVRSRNTVEILTKNVALYSVACLMYLFVGYQIMYAGGPNGFIPGLGFGLGADNTVAEVVASDGDIYYSNTSDFFFQVVFAAATMSIISGAVAERMKLWSFLLFAVVMTSVIYPVQGYWSWGEGWLDALGYADYAGSAIVHMAGGAAALAGVILLGPRKGKYGPGGEVRAIPGANLPLATVGMFALWLGWFGFNGGSELKLSDIESANAVALVFTNTNMAAAAGLVAAMLVSRVMFGKSDLTMLINGALAGLVSITAGPDVPSNMLAVLIGAIGGVLVVFSIVFLDRMKIDDPVGAISVHGTCGIWGVLAVLLWMEDATFLAQITGIVAIFAWMFLVSLIVWGTIKAVMGLRVSDGEEDQGMDITECGMEAYPEFTKQS